MKAAVINAPNTEVRIEERERPSAGPGQVLIRVQACGVCHGDLMLQLGQFPFARYPIVPGHEIAGVIEEVGKDVAELQPGARVGLSALFSSCGCCKQCFDGDEFLCSQMQFTGITKDGGYQQFMLAPAAYVAPLPAGLDFAEAAPLMCAGLTVFSGLRHAGFEQMELEYFCRPEQGMELLEYWKEERLKFYENIGISRRRFTRVEIRRARDLLGRTGDGTDCRGRSFVWGDSLRQFSRSGRNA